MLPEKYCREEWRRVGAGMRLIAYRLPKRHRAALRAVYAVFSAIEGVPYECQDAAVAAQTLAWWQKDVAVAFSGSLPEHPALQALQTHIRHFNLPQSCATDLIRAALFEAETLRVATIDDLDAQGAALFGTPLVWCARIGAGGLPESDTVAISLGRVLYRFYVWRNAGRDARQGRIFIPTTTMEQYDARAAAWLNCRPDPGAERLLDDWAVQTESSLVQILQGLPEKQRVLRMAARMALKLAQEMRQDGPATVFRYRLSLPAGRQILTAVQEFF